VRDEVFLDTSYAIALAARSDLLHSQAVSLARELETRRTRIVTTQAILLEIGNALSKKRYRTAAAHLISSLLTDPIVTVLPLTQELFTEAFELYRNRPDKDWGLVDCTSFATMTSLDIGEALTADEHFIQAAFQALLLQP